MRERFEPASGVNLEAAIREIVRQEIETALARRRLDRRADEDRWLDVKAAAAYLSCPVERLYANHSPDLPRVKWGDGCSSASPTSTSSWKEAHERDRLRQLGREPPAGTAPRRGRAHGDPERGHLARASDRLRGQGDPATGTPPQAATRKGRTHKRRGR